MSSLVGKVIELDAISCKFKPYLTAGPEQDEFGCSGVALVV